jgi:hypothetical protein
LNIDYFNGLSNEQKLRWKQQLKVAAINILQKRIETAEEAMLQAQDAANSEEKSSVGDKYETSRAMGHLDSEMNAKQLEEAERELAILNSLTVNTLQTKGSTGTVVVCNDYIFFIALGLGTVVIDGLTVILLSPQAPVATLLNGKKAGDSFVFNTNTVEIMDVF